MPKNIKAKHLDRMFPFEFFDELNENMRDYKLHNPAFMLADSQGYTKKQRKEIYHNVGADIQKQAQESLKQLRKDNITTVEPFGDMLLLDICIETKVINDMIDNTLSKTEKSQTTMCVLAVQLYDSSNLPVFSKDVTEETIAKIPEVLWDDPNLGIYILIFSEDGVEVGIITIPQRIQDLILEPTDKESKEGDA